MSNMAAFGKRAIYAVMAFCLLACDSESERVVELRNKIGVAKKKLEVLQQNRKNLKEEMGRVWVRSLEYRFPQIRPIPKGEDIPQNISGLPYLRAIHFEFIDNHTLNFRCTYRTPRKEKFLESSSVDSKFTLYLFDNNFGINICRQDIAETLKKGKDITKNYKIEIKSRYIPQYFMIGTQQ